MTEKELRKLKRSDFLQLLLAQGKDMSELQERLDDTTRELELLRNVSESLRGRLDEKDALIKDLKGQLDSKEATIRTLRLEIEDMTAILKSIRLNHPEDGSSAASPGNLNDIYEAKRAEKIDSDRKNRSRSRNKR